jgi:putative sigma-54 modulation protein
MELSKEVKTYIDEKARKLPHYYDRVMAVQVIVDDMGPLKRVELIVSVAGHEDFVAHEKGDDIFACFDICMDRSEKQLRRFKDRVRSNKHNTPLGALGTEEIGSAEA